MSAVTTKLIGHRGDHSRFAIYRKSKPDGCVWFSAHDAYTVTDAEVRAGKKPRSVRNGADFNSVAKWCDAQ